MPDSPELAAAKRDGEYLRSILGVSRDGPHEKCPLCNGKSLSVYPKAELDGEYHWKCHRGCGGGTVVDALMATARMDQTTAIHTAVARFKSPVAARPLPKQEELLPPRYIHIEDTRGAPDPVLDMDRAQAFIKAAHEHLMDDLDIPKRHRRGITPEIIEKYNLGFIENVRLSFTPGRDNSRGWLMPAAWVFPITGEDGTTLKAVKLHFEKRPMMADGTEFGGKSLWAPFGKPDKNAKPNDKIRHGVCAFWPHPSTLGFQNADINTDITWWLDKIPPGSDIEKVWKERLTHECKLLEINLRKPEKDFSDHERWVMHENAWAKCKSQIMEFVCAQRDGHSAENNGKEPDIDWRNFIIIACGELKAMALLSAGYRGCSLTSGESVPPPQLLSAFAATRVALFCDDDPPFVDSKGTVRCPGRHFGMGMSAALRHEGALEVVCIYGGQKDV